MSQDAKSLWQMALLGLAVAGLAAGGVLHLATAGDADRWAWATATVIVLTPMFVSVVTALLRRETGVDVIEA